VNSLTWLVARYRETSDWLALSDATRRQRDNIFVGVLKKSGDERYRDIQKSDIVAGKNARAGTPAQARNFLDAMRGLFRWALEAQHVKIDPTAGVKNPKRMKNAEGFKKWSEEEVAAYHAKWPVGTRERVWFDVLLFTGLRRGDAVRLGCQHIRNGVATIKTEKSGFNIEVSMPIHPNLQVTLDAGPTADLAFICGALGKQLKKETFGNYFKAACKQAGVDEDKKAAHGMRKISATRLAEAGCSEYQLMAVFGWTDPKMAAHYVREANRKMLSRQAFEKLSGTKSPAPLKSAGINVKKRQ
jgi:integrase